MGGTQQADLWFCGPPRDRKAYSVDDVDDLGAGRSVIARARRRAFTGDTVGFTGPVSLKLLVNVPAERVAALQAMWQVLAGLDHPGVVRVLEVFTGPGLHQGEVPPETDGEVCYVASEWVDGASLRELAPLPPAEAFRLARDLADAVATLHGHGVLHCDLHPGNVVVRPDGQATLIDFDVARPVGGPGRPGVVGALGFTAPECTTSAATVATDRWGVGALVAFALLGVPRGTTKTRQFRREMGTALTALNGADAERCIRSIEAMTHVKPEVRPVDLRAWARDLECGPDPRG